MRLIFALLFVLVPASAIAQTYPVHENLYVNDFAAIISDEDEAALMQQLTALRRDKGIEVTVLTIDSRNTYGDSASIESFATGLFNTWGIGNAKRNDGILILVARHDREMRVELGRGYSDEFNAAAGDVIDQHFLLSFQYDKYSEGIRTGTNEVIRRIAMPLAEGKDRPIHVDKPWDPALVLFFSIFGGFFALFFSVVFFQRIADFFARFRKCPNCGRKGGIRRYREVTSSASTISSGSGILTTTCDHCDYRREQNYTIPRRSSSRSSSSSSGSSFGGGSSSGGGASGRW